MVTRETTTGGTFPDDAARESAVTEKSEKLEIIYHQQDNGLYCGPACVQMVLTAVDRQRRKPIREIELLDQFSLYLVDHLTSTATGWQTDPNGVAGALNYYENFLYYDDEKENGRRNYGRFRVFVSESSDAISRMIVWSIQEYKRPAVALVWGGAHWVVVNGYRTGPESESGLRPEPTSSWDIDYDIEEFIINDPSPQIRTRDLRAPSPPPHWAGDECGIGGSRGEKNHRIPYETWLCEYMYEPVSDNLLGHDEPGTNELIDQFRKESTAWLGKYVAICAARDTDKLVKTDLSKVRQPRKAKLQRYYEDLWKEINHHGDDATPYVLHIGMGQDETDEAKRERVHILTALDDFGPGWYTKYRRNEERQANSHVARRDRARRQDIPVPMECRQGSQS